MTYTELVANITAFLDRQDLSAVAPTFIALAEERFNRTLRLNALTAQTTLTVLAGNSSVALPADYREGRALAGADYETWQQVTPERLAELKSFGDQDTCFSIFGGSLQIPYEVDADKALTLTYWTKIPALTVSNTTNWLSLNHPGVYLWACLAEAAIYTVNPQQGAVYENRAAQAIAELQASESAAAYFAGSIAGSYVV